MQAVAQDDGRPPPQHSPMGWARLQRLWQREEAWHPGLRSFISVQSSTDFHFIWSIWSDLTALQGKKHGLQGQKVWILGDWEIPEQIQSSRDSHFIWSIWWDLNALDVGSWTESRKAIPFPSTCISLVTTGWFCITLFTLWAAVICSARRRILQSAATEAKLGLQGQKVWILRDWIPGQIQSSRDSHFIWSIWSDLNVLDVGSWAESRGQLIFHTHASVW